MKKRKKRNERFYVYKLINPFTNEPFYVGKGTGDRMFHHVRLVKKGKYPNNNKLLFNVINNILNDSGEVQYDIVIENVAETVAYNVENSEILKYGRRDIKTGKLCNLSDGGSKQFSGFKQSNEHVNKRMDKWNKWKSSLTDEEYSNYRNSISQSSKKTWETKKDKHLHGTHLSDPEWRALYKEKHFNGLKRGKEHSNYIDVSEEIINRAVELYETNLGRRKVYSKLKEEYEINFSLDKMISILKNKGIYRSAEEANEKKKKRVPIEYVDSVIKYYIECGNVMNKVIKKYKGVFSERVLRRCLIENNVYKGKK